MREDADKMLRRRANKNGKAPIVFFPVYEVGYKEIGIKLRESNEETLSHIYIYIAGHVEAF